MAQPAIADNFLWIGPPSIFKDWNDENNWMNITPGGLPGIPGGADTATFNTNAITSGGTALNLAIGSAAALSIATGSVVVNGGTVTNQSILTFAGAGLDAEILYVSGAVMLTGGGELKLVDANSQILVFTGGSTLTNLDNLIHGGNGAIIAVPVINRNIVLADNGLLNLQAPVDNTAAGASVQVESGATLDLGGTILSGLLNVTLGGTVQNGTLSNVTSPGTLTLPPNLPLILENTFTNQGLVTFAGAGLGQEILFANGAVTLTGGGELKLVDANSLISTQVGGSTLTNIDNLIHGGNGAIIAVPVINRNIVLADNGLLNLQAPIDNTAAGASVQVESGATLDLGGTILSGLLNVTLGGTVQTGTLNNVTSPGTLTLPPNLPLILENTFTNQGLVTFAGAGLGPEILYVDGAVTLTGGGELKLVDANSQISVFTGGSTLTNLDNLIHGGNGAIIAAPVINQNIVRADNGLLNISAPIDNTAAGASVAVTSGATLDLGGTTLNGLLNVAVGGIAQNGTLSNVTSPGTLTLPPNLPLILENTFTNQGLVTFAGAGLGPEILYVDGAVTLTGGGELRLVDANSQISVFTGGSTLTNLDNLIHGGNGAFIAVPITNQGTILADNGTLNIQAPIDNSAGTLQTQVSGLNPGEFTVLHFSDATLGGTLEVTFLNGFLPQTGDVLKPIQIDGIVSGDFAQVTFGGIASGFQFQTQILGGFYQITALNDARPAPVIISPLSAMAVVGLPFIYQIVSMPSANSYNTSALPAGLSLDPNNGIISGVPTQAGSYQITLIASGDGTGTAILNLTIQPSPTSGPVITSSMASSGRTGQPFTFQVTTSGTTSAVRVATSGLPPGLTVNPVTGLISGTPATDGSFGVTLTVTDGPAVATGTLQLTFTSDPEFPIIISSQTAGVMVGQSFSYTIIAPGSSDPSDPTIFGLVGILPNGLSFNAKTGTISGTFTGFSNRVGHGDLSVLPDVSGGVVTNVELFASNSHGTSVIPLLFFVEPPGTVNISTRLAVGTGDDVLIAGFIITGNAPKKVLLRAIGPSLPLQNTLQDPTLDLYDGAEVLSSNDNWRDTQQDEIIGTTIPPPDDRESAILAYLNPGAYTAIVRGQDNTTGVAVAEVYDLGTASLDPSGEATLAQISTRGFVETDDNVMIGGFIIRGAATKVLVRAVGPSLNGVVPGALQDTTLELHDGSGATIVSNDDWRSDQETEIIATGAPPTDDRESAVVSTLQPGAYTGIVRGKSGATGIALVEVYALP